MKPPRLIPKLLAALVFSVLPSASLAVAPGAGDGGCCGALSDAALEQVARANDVPLSVANDLLNNRFSNYSNDRLRMLEAMPGQACMAENVCNEMSDDFFRFLAREALARRSDAAQRRAAVWDFWRNVGLFFLATLGAVLGVLNYRDKLLERRSKKP